MYSDSPHSPWTDRAPVLHPNASICTWFSCGTGSSLGGLLTRAGGSSAPLFGALVCSGINLSAARALPNRTTSRANGEINDPNQAASSAASVASRSHTAEEGAELEDAQMDWATAWNEVTTNSELLVLLGCKFFVGSAFFIMTGTFDLLCKERFDLDPETCARTKS